MRARLVNNVDGLPRICLGELGEEARAVLGGYDTFEVLVEARDAGGRLTDVSLAPVDNTEADDRARRELDNLASALVDRLEVARDRSTDDGRADEDAAYWKGAAEELVHVLAHVRSKRAALP